MESERESQDGKEIIINYEVEGENRVSLSSKGINPDLYGSASTVLFIATKDIKDYVRKHYGRDVENISGEIKIRLK